VIKQNLLLEGRSALVVSKYWQFYIISLGIKKGEKLSCNGIFAGYLSLT
jgi:hypothetical protein